MSDHSLIEWTDATWNPITGCSVVSPGCTNCYAMQLAGTRLRNHPSRAGLTRESAGRHVWNGQVRFNTEWLDKPLRWRRPRRVFVCAHGDLFHEAVPDAWIAAVFGIMAAAPQHTFQVLTKRPERMLRWFEWRISQIRKRDLQWEPWRICEEEASELVPNLPAIGCQSNWPLANVWLGVSVEDQRRADERIPLLLQIPAAVRWLSCEPLLGPVDLDCWPQTGCSRNWLDDDGCIDWVVVGGESGAHARPMHPVWARSLRDQCAAAGVPYFHKQNGLWVATQPVAGGDLGGDMRRGDVRIVKADGSEGNGHFRRGDALMRRVKNKHESGRLLDGVEHNGMPA